MNTQRFVQVIPRSMRSLSAGLAMLAAEPSMAESPTYEASLSLAQQDAICTTDPGLAQSLGFAGRCQSAQKANKSIAKLYSIDQDEAFQPALKVQIADPGQRDLLIAASVGVFYKSVGTAQVIDEGPYNDATSNAGSSKPPPFSPRCAGAIDLGSSAAGKLSYDQNCLSDVSKLPQPYLDAGVNDVLVTFLRRVKVGVEYELTPFCMGVRIKQDEVLTAKHCFYTDKGALLPDTKVLIDQPNALRTVARFMDASQRDENYAVDVINPQPSGWKYANGDWILMRIRSVAGALPAHDFTKGPTWNPDAYPAASGEPLLLVGPHQFASANAVAPTLRDSWVATLRFTKNSECAVWKKVAEGGCSTHTCQTSEGYSGSPLLRMAGARMQIVGVHVGDGVGKDCPPPASAIVRRINVATVPTILDP